MTLNVAHGRNKSLNQVFLKRAAIRANLDRITEVLRREQPDIVALQEVDGVALWSGNFNHVSHLASGGNLKAVSDRVGHSRMSMTADVYAHSVEGMQGELVNTMDRLFG